MYPFAIRRPTGGPRNPLDLAEDRFRRMLEKFPESSIPYPTETGVCLVNMHETDEAIEIT